MAPRSGSLRAKLTLALLVTGLTSAMLVGVIARWILFGGAAAAPAPATHEAGYLEAMDNAVTYGVFGAGALAIALGFLFSAHLSSQLSVLTRAIQAIGQGELRQKVSVNTGDEVGILADAFNSMSAELARTHAQLQQSHDTIREQAELLKELSIRDDMTGLHNRRFFTEQVTIAYAQAKRYARPLTVMLGDIDFFKRVNDRFSHAVGDEVLRQVAGILATTTRDTDVVARYGGEEFVVAFTETALSDAVVTCERIRRRIEEHDWSAIHRDLRVTMTIGLDDVVRRGSAEQMLAAADERLYQGKQSGRNRVCAERPAART